MLIIKRYMQAIQRGFFPPLVFLTSYTILLTVVSKTISKLVSQFSLVNALLYIASGLWAPDRNASVF